MGGRRRRTRVQLPGEAVEKEEAEDGKSFFACYLLCSVSPRFKGRTYIGFTVNPRRRIRQHNGEIRSGAWRTKHGRPWEMILCIYGFPSNVSALQFEWAWQHPRESLAVRKAASSFKSLSGIVNKIKLAYTMLSLPSWENLNLTVNFFSTKYMKHTAGCPRMPKQMRVTVCVMDDLPCYVDGQILDGDDDKEDTDEDSNRDEANDCPVGDEIPSSAVVNACHSKSMSNAHLGHPMDLKGSQCIYESAEPGDEFNTASSSYQIDEIFSWSESTDLGKAVVPKKPSCLVESPQNINECRLSSSKASSSCSEDSCEWLQEGNQPKQQSTPRSYNEGVSSDSLLFSSEGNIINLSTPSSCMISTKRASVILEIIDLTDSPGIIQL